MGSKKKIAIISALAEELDYLYEETALDWGDYFDLEGLQVKKCVIKNCEFVATHASGKMGLTEVAILTTRVIMGFKPDFIAMIGVCGGFKERGVNIGDVIVAEKSFHYQFGSFKDGSMQRELKVCEVDLGYFTRLTNFLNPRRMSEIQNSSTRRMIKSDKVLKVYSGPMASADLVVKDEDKLGEAQVAERKVIAVDMESYAFLRASQLLGVKSVVVKSVSDFADFNKIKYDDLREYAKYNATEALYKFIINEFNISMDSENKNPSKKITVTNSPEESIVCNSSKLISNPDDSFFEKISNEMVLVPAGQFKVKKRDLNEHIVKINKSYLMCKMLVTQSLYEDVMEKNPSYFKGKKLPVENVTWFNAIHFCNVLSEKCKLQQVYNTNEDVVSIDYEKNGFRLPTEAEWELACRGDTSEERYGDLEKIARYHKNSKKRTWDVGLSVENAFGLFDMLGNVWEWCNDWFGEDYMEKDLDDYKGPENGIYRIVKGGSWANFENSIGASKRDRYHPLSKKSNRGFRFILPKN